jgi:hypothetical protein
MGVIPKVQNVAAILAVSQVINAVNVAKVRFVV